MNLDLDIYIPIHLNCSPLKLSCSYLNLILKAGAISPELNINSPSLSNCWIGPTPSDRTTSL